MTANRISYFEVPDELLMLLLLLGLIVFMWDLFERKRSRLREASGISPKSEVVSVKGSAYLPPRQFRALRAGILSVPDALLKEEGILIPVSIKPVGDKVRDRHVIELMAHMRAIEEIEGVAPPYGLLILGPNARQVRIKNAEDKQRWLSSLIDEMRSIALENVPAIATPAKFKCKHCDVRNKCEFSAYHARSGHDAPEAGHVAPASSRKKE